LGRMAQFAPINTCLPKLTRPMRECREDASTWRRA
jgi:hypothetical protein